MVAGRSCSGASLGAAFRGGFRGGGSRACPQRCGAFRTLLRMWKWGMCSRIFALFVTYRGFGWRFLPFLGRMGRGWWRRGRFFDAGQLAHLLQKLHVSFDFPIQLHGKDRGENVVKFRAGLNSQGPATRRWAGEIESAGT